MQNLANSFDQQKISRSPCETEKEEDANGILNTLDRCPALCFGVLLDPTGKVGRQNEPTNHQDEDDNIDYQNDRHWDQETADLRPHLKKASKTERLMRMCVGRSTRVYVCMHHTLCLHNYVSVCFVSLCT